MTDYIREQIKKLWCANVPVASIIRMLPCKEKDAREYLKAMRENGELTKIQRKRDTKKILTEMFEQGKDVYEICEELKIDTLTLYCYCSMYKIKIKRSKNYRKKRLKPKLEDLNEKTQKIVEQLKAGISNVEAARLNSVSRQYVCKLKKKYLARDLL